MKTNWVRYTLVVACHLTLSLFLIGCKSGEIVKPQMESSFDAKTKVDPINPHVEKLELSLSFKTKW